MSEIEYVYIQTELSSLTVPLEYPAFGIFGKGDSVEDVWYWQPKGELAFSEEKGFSCITDDHGLKAKAFLEKARQKNAGLVITPEYSTPWNELECIVDKTDYWPTYGKLWCLGMEGIHGGDLDAVYECYSEKDDVFVIMEDQNQLNRKSFCSCIVYLFTTAKRELVCVIQLKTTAASDAWNELESRSLTKGSKIYVFDEERERSHILLTYLCADVLNMDLMCKIPEYTECLILHPQLNPKPCHDSFRQMRKHFLDYSVARIISVNWAKETFLPSSGRRNEIMVRESFSAFYHNVNFVSKNLEELLVRNKAKGINLNKDDHILVWRMPAGEHCMIFSIKNMSSGRTYKVAENHMEPIGCEYQEYDSESGSWMDKDGCINCSVDWEWLKSVFQLEPCREGECDIVKLDCFFAVLFAEKPWYDMEGKGGTDGLLFEKSAGDVEEMRKKRERARYVNEELKEGNYPERFSFLKDKNYRWILGENFNLSVENAFWPGINVVYIDSAEQYVINMGIGRLESLIGKGQMEKVLLYYMTNKGIRYKDNLCNTEINSPELTVSKNSLVS